MRLFAPSKTLRITALALALLPAVTLVTVSTAFVIAHSSAMESVRSAPDGPLTPAGEPAAQTVLPQASSQVAASVFRTAGWSFALLSGLAVLLVIACMQLARSLTQPLAKTAKFVASLAQGRLEPLDAKTKARLGTAGGAMDALVSRLRTLLGGVDQTTRSAQHDSARLLDQAKAAQGELEETRARGHLLTKDLDALGDIAQRRDNQLQTSSVLVGLCFDSAEQGCDAMEQTAQIVPLLEALHRETAELRAGLKQLALRSNVLALRTFVDSTRAPPRPGTGLVNTAAQLRTIAGRCAELTKASAALDDRFGAAARATQRALTTTQEALRTNFMRACNVSTHVHQLSHLAQEQEVAMRTVTVSTRDVVGRTERSVQQLRDCTHGLAVLESDIVHMRSLGDSFSGDHKRQLLAVADTTAHAPLPLSFVCYTQAA